jgi:hypothetical protein
MMMRIPKIKTVTGPPGSASATAGVLMVNAAMRRPSEATQKIPVFLQSFLTLKASAAGLVLSPSKESRLRFNKISTPHRR